MDEAYQPFASRTWLDRMPAEPARNGHVLLMRTLSKFGLAGVRLGYLIGPTALVGEIDKVRPPYNVSVLNCEARCSRWSTPSICRTGTELRTQREVLLAALRSMPGIQKMLGQRGQHGAGARARRRPHLCRHARAQGPDQERF